VKELLKSVKICQKLLPKVWLLVFLEHSVFAKTRIMTITYGEEINHDRRLNHVDTHNHVDTVHKCDRQMDRFTITKTALCIASHDNTRMV